MNGQRCAMRVKPMVGAICLALAPAAFAANGDSIEALRQDLERQKEIIQRLEQRLSEEVAARKQVDQKVEAQAAAAAKPAAKPLVTIYGVLDGGVEHITNIGADRRSLTRVPPITATAPSRLGFRLEKEFSPGYSAVGLLEAGFNLDDGKHTQAERLFGRQLYAGLSTPYGSFTIGRQYSMLLYAMMASDMLGPNIYANGSLDNYLPNTRYDSSLAWQGKFSKTTLGLAYSFGRDTSGGAPASGTCAGEQNSINDSQECKAVSAMVRYDDTNFGLAAGVDQIRGGTGATAFFFNGAAPFAFSSSSDKDRRINLGGYVKLGAAKLSAGWLGRKVSTSTVDVSSDLYYLNASYALTEKITLDGGLHRIVNDDQDRNATLAVLRGFYKLDKGLDAYVQTAYLDNSDKAAYAISAAGPGTAPAAGQSQSAYMMGLRFMF